MTGIRYFNTTSISMHPDMDGLSRLCHQGVLQGTGLPWISQSLNGKRWAKVKVSSQSSFSFISFIGILLFQEENKNGEISLKDYKEGQVQQLDMEEVGNRIPNQTCLFYLSGGCSRRWQGDVWNMGPVFESFTGHVKEHWTEAQAVDPSGEEQVLLELLDNLWFWIGHPHF